MPFGSYGFGVMFYGGRGRINEKIGHDNCSHFDGLDCFNIFMPFTPCYPVHVWDWYQVDSEWSWTKRVTQFSYRAIPVRWSTDLVCRVMLRMWLWLPFFFGQLYMVSQTHGILSRLFGFLMFAGSGAGLALLWYWDQRDQKIRKTLGRHRLGFSDPAYWTDELLNLVAAPSSWFSEGGERVPGTFADACRQLIQQRNHRGAMWAARLCMALESPHLGESLTDEILSLAKQPSESQDSLFPILDMSGNDKSDYWHDVFLGRSHGAYTETMYANHVGGGLAAAFDDDEVTPEEERSIVNTPWERPQDNANVFRWQGFAIVLGVIGLCFLPNFFPTWGAANLARARQIANPPNLVNKRSSKKPSTEPPAERSRGKKPETPPQPPSDFPNGVYLVDLPLVDSKSGPWPVSTNGTTGARFRNRIIVAGKPSPKGIGMHPPEKDYASATFALNGKYKTFRAHAALNDSVTGTRDVVTFEVWGDGKRLWHSPQLKIRAEQVKCEVNVAAVQKLELRAIARGDYWSIHAVWVEPRLGK